MPKTSTSLLASTYHSGTFRHLYTFPDVYHDPLWISRWKFDDISTGYALDSKHTNNLLASGAPTQTSGYRQTYATEFDGVDDCFYLPWASGSGLQGLIINRTDQSNALTTPNFGIMCSLLVKDFSQDQYIVSKINGNTTDREWGIGINPSGGIFFAFKPDGLSSLYFHNSSRSGLIPSGQWIDFYFAYCGRHTSSNNISIIVNNQILTDQFSLSDVEEVGSSGVFVIGAANWGLNPSGFFKGTIEDFRFYNGKHPSLPNYNAFHSGISPISTYPGLVTSNPYLGAHLRLNSMPSGNNLYPGYSGTQYNAFYLEERANNQNLLSSGTNWSTNAFNLIDGAAEGTKGSGLKMLASSTALFSREVGKTKADTLLPRHSFTLSWWSKSNRAPNIGESFLGTRTVTNPGPFRLEKTTTGQTRIYISDETTSSILSLNQRPLSSGVWVHQAAVVDLEQNRIDMYVSGLWTTTNAISPCGLWLRDGTDYFYLGHVNSNLTLNPLSGILDEIAIIHYPAPSSQITQLYSSQSGFFLDSYVQSGMIGAYASGEYAFGGSGLVGGYAQASEPTQQDAQFTAFFSIIGRDRKEFDAQVQVFKSKYSDFDAQAVVYSKELLPDVSIFEPSTNQSGTTVPVTYTFEANASGTQGKSIYRTFWFFSDDTSTSGSTVTSSGTYRTTHTFSKSGIFDVIFVATDSNGIINSDRKKVSTVSGMTTAVITLNATPMSGVTPLQVAFSGVITSAPNPIVDKYIYFGDGTRSASTDSIYKMYPVIGAYVPVFRARDTSGIIVTDSTVVGGNS